MRDPARIDRMIERLRELWHASPDLRLGQLLVNVIRPGEPCPRVFYAEDADTEAKLASDQEALPERARGTEVALKLTRAEALVLFEFVNRFTDTDALSIEHPAEARILWDVCALLEKQLIASPDRSWPDFLAEARAEVGPDTADELPHKRDIKYPNPE